MQPSRRQFFKGAAAAALAGAAAAAPVGAGLCALLSPLSDPSAAHAPFVRVAALEAVPPDGVPRKFTVVEDRIDAWTKSPNIPVGAVYLRRDATGNIAALNAICPHAGGLVDYLPGEQCFLCPLHKSQFNADGSIKDDRSPAARGMDALEAEVRDGAIWVRFENFRAGVAQKIPS